MADPRTTHTLSEFIAAGKTSTNIDYSKLSFIEKRDSIEYPLWNILNDYLYEFKQSTLTITLDDDEQFKYKYRPKLLANEIYGNPELYFVILLMNDICNVKDFAPKSIKLLRVDDMNDMLSKIYNAEKRNIQIYNGKTI